MRLDKLKALEQYLQRSFDVNQTLRQLNSRYMMCWGAHNITPINDKGLLISVNGHLHKGKVLISLRWDDTYIVTLLNTHNNVKESFEDIYCDELSRVIDEKVERLPHYVN